MNIYHYATSVAEDMLWRADEDLWQSCDELIRHVFGFEMALSPTASCFDIYKYLVNNVME